MHAAKHTDQILPVSLLVEGQHCLVVGGGKVAARKTNHLLDAAANVTVVSSEANEDILQLAKEGKITYRQQDFTDADVNGCILIFAATNDRAVNRHILNVCRERGVLCCCVDGNWPAGDFVTPAIFRKDGLIVSVSTGGQSCRRSRLVKENLARHVEMVETADLIVMGTSHNCLSVEEREPFHLVGERAELAGQMLMQVWGIHEFMLLNTCNRVELVAIVARSDALAGVLKRILGFDHLSNDRYYTKRGFDAFKHVSIMSAGLLSQTPGENHIVAQIKKALDQSVEADWAGGMMQEWISSALHVSKDIRQETGPLLRKFEIEDLCVDYILAECPDLANRRVMVLGSGTVGKGLVRNLLQHIPSCDWCYHVNEPDVPEAWKSRVTLCTFNDLRDRLSTVDIVACATSSSGHVLHQGHAPFFDQEKSICIVDLAMPRNVAPELDRLTPNLRVIDLDDLKHWYRRKAADMNRILELSKQTVDEHKDLYEKIIRSFQGGNTSE